MNRVFITGASSGIGAALAREYAAQGATVGLLARRRDALEQLAASLPNPSLHKVYAVDVTDHAEDLAVFETVFATNVAATVATFAPFIASMKAQGGAPTLVGIGSVAGIRGLPGAGAYSASKAAVLSYCESLRLELKPHGIRVVTIAPGYIDTPMTRHNPYPMPFLMPAARFAQKAAAAIAAGDSYRVIPWQMGVVAKLLRALPNAVYDMAFVRAPRKPRGSDA
jgi:short-subunit dehydrogenase